MTARIAPTSTALIVNSGIFLSAGINELKSSLDDIDNQYDKYISVFIKPSV
jgi:hypothetical protein